MPDPEAYRLALWELGIPAQNALAFTGSAAGLRTANSAGLATVLMNPDGTGARDVPAAAALLVDYGGTEPLHIADCRRLHERSREIQKPSAA